jgi:hypothetical protein
MAELSLPGASQAILIGVSGYENLEDLPSVDNNLTGLQAALTSPSIWGLPADNCTVLRQPENSDAVLDTLQEVGSAVADTLIFYFAGHGLIDPENDDELYLALPRSDRRRTYRTAIPYSWVRREMQAARARRRVVILDCCYSGRALGLMGEEGATELADRLEIEGTCVLTATARTRRALAPPDQPFTAFSGELIALLTEGIPSGPDLLDMDTLYQHLVTRLRARSLPLPQRGEMNRGGNIALARNQTPRPQPVATLTVSRVEAPAPPVVSGSGRQLIDVNRQVTTTRANSSSYSDVLRSALVMILAVSVWAAGAGYVAWMWEPHTWLWAAGASGLASLVGAGMRKQSARFALRFLAVPSLGSYIFSAVTGNGHWIERAAEAGIILFPGLILWAMETWKFEAEFYRDYKLQGERQRRVAALVQKTRWLTDARPDNTGLALLNPLMDVPAARFSCLQDSSLQYIAVAGTQVLLVAFVGQSGNAYPGVVEPALVSVEPQKIADEAESWRKLMRSGDRASVRVMMIGLPGLLTLPGSPVFRPGAGVGITFTAPDSFADAAISILADGAYELNLRVLERVHSQLHSTSQDGPSTRHTAVSLQASAPQAGSVPQMPTAVLPGPADAPFEPTNALPSIARQNDAEPAALPD